MSHKQSRRPFKYTWPEAKADCRLSELDIEMARRLGLGPNQLIGAIPRDRERWRLPVNLWILETYKSRFGETLNSAPPQDVPSATAVRRDTLIIPPPSAGRPWPDYPEIPALPKYRDDPWGDSIEDYQLFADGDWDYSISEEEMHRQDVIENLRRQHMFRNAAQLIVIAFREVPEVKKVMAFGSAALPLVHRKPSHLPRKSKIKTPHRCKDLDLAVWMATFTNLKALKNALSITLADMDESCYGNLDRREVDIHLIDFATGGYQGRLCGFGQCPKPRVWECRVPDCGSKPFLQQINQYEFNRTRFEAEPKILLFDRNHGFLVDLPGMEEAPPIIWEETSEGDDPF